MICTDQLNRTVSIPEFPKRIISLVPSQTELLSDLGLEAFVCGITKFCVHPVHWRNTKTIIGGTKNLRMDVIRNLNPDCIIANKEENTQEQIELLEKEFPVWISDIHDLDSALEMIHSIGIFTGTNNITEILIKTIRNISNISPHPVFFPNKVLYLIWKDPWITVGNDTFIHSMLNVAGYANTAGHLSRYPEITVDEITRLKPDLVFLSSEPYPFKENHVAGLQKLLPNSMVLTVDGEAFSWYGSRMLQAFPYFASLRSRILDSLL